MPFEQSLSVKDILQKEQLLGDRSGERQRKGERQRERERGRERDRERERDQRSVKSRDWLP